MANHIKTGAAFRGYNMTRRKGEITARMNERDFPHTVELALPEGGGFGARRLTVIKEFHRLRGTAPLTTCPWALHATGKLRRVAQGAAPEWGAGAACQIDRGVGGDLAYLAAKSLPSLIRAWSIRLQRWFRRNPNGGLANAFGPAQSFNFAQDGSSYRVPR